MIPSFTLIAAPNLVYRVSRSPESQALAPWEHILNSARGRYDDTAGGFRVLYTSSSPIGALIETIADLRPQYRCAAEIAAIGHDGEDEDAAYARLILHARAAMLARLEGRYLGAIRVVDREPVFVDLSAGATRSRIELHINAQTLKIGDLIGSERASSRRAARAIYDAGHAGIIAPSAEAGRAETIAIFEAAHNSNAFRVALRYAWTRAIDTASDLVTKAVRLLLAETDRISHLICPELDDRARPPCDRRLLVLEALPRTERSVLTWATRRAASSVSASTSGFDRQAADVGAVTSSYRY
jgi:hypothetical protein